MRNPPEPSVAPTRTEAVFIVGVSRSGTSLMRRILNKSSEIGIAKENHFLGHLISNEGMRQRLRRVADITDDAGAREFVDSLYSGRLARTSRLRGMSTQWEWIVKRVDREELLARILASDRSERALFTLMMQLFADHGGKRIIGEKTPAHFRFATTLLEWFPNGKIIHMLRDPRAIFVSELRRRTDQAVTWPYRELRRFPPLFKLFILLQVSLVWRESVRRCYRQVESSPDRYLAVRFEDLVRGPEAQVRQICTFLGVEFEERMLQQKVVSRGFAAGETGFDAMAADRWRKEISPLAGAWFFFLFRKDLRRLGYVDGSRRSVALGQE